MGQKRTKRKSVIKENENENANAIESSSNVVHDTTNKRVALVEILAQHKEEENILNKDKIKFEVM